MRLQESNEVLVACILSRSVCVLDARFVCSGGHFFGPISKSEGVGAKVEKCRELKQ